MSFSPESVRRLTRRELLIASLGLTANAALGDDLRQISEGHKASRDPELGKFMTSIKARIEKKDYRALEALMQPEFRVEFDSGKGPKAFHKYWQPESEQSPLWGVLNRLFALNGAYYSDTLFVLPFVYKYFPIDLDPLAHAAVVSEQADLLASPAADSAKVGTVGRSIITLAKPVELPIQVPFPSFLELNHPQVGKCFVAASDIYLPAAHRAFFEKRNGRWHWISLVAGTMAEPPDLIEMRKAGISL